MTRRIFLDTEWTAPPWSERSELMWIGLADEEGRSWYAISADVEIDPATNDFISGVFGLITPTEPRLSRDQIADAVVDFCGEVDEFWAWIPTLQSVTDFFDLADEEAAELYAEYWDWDLQLVRSLVRPWPQGWPDRLRDLNAAAAAAGVEVPPRAKNHLHPRIHAEWNRSLFELIRPNLEG
ncbi:MAG: hypothetical protein QNJ81_05100 [Acidimicrobiia bacterium]|nr:hypothetical protein [Acidimicrobiia bacterium]